MEFKAPRGTSDHIPDEKNRWNKIELIARDTARSFGYNEITTPVFEQTGLFKRAVGEGTDVVQKEMYNLTDLGGNEYTLRPEGTAPVCRAFIEHGMHNLPYPLRLFYIEPMFRHERPQSGRMRQHHQFGVEIFGDDSPEADAEIILVGLTYLNKLGIKNLKLKLNSIGNKNSRENFKKEFMLYFSPFKDNLPDIDKKKFNLNPIRILDSKEMSTRKLIANSPKPIDFLDDESKEHWKNLQLILNKSITQFEGIELEIDKNLVRGLDYYSKTVFEIEPISDIEKSQSSILSGGRYDNLISYLGGPDTPAAGFGSGIERVLLSADTNLFEDKNFTDLTIISLTREAWIETNIICNELRKKGVVVVNSSFKKSFKSQMRYANQIKSKSLLVIGENELNSEVVELKELVSGKITKSKLNANEIFLKLTSNE
mgnify:CR=1 FL=1|tara:strand:+ start:5415 stop:6695 length:1281 start_codon:yes stop_codon:yes gene_type:complete